MASEIMRFVSTREATYSSKKGSPSVEIVIASNEPVERYDEDRDEMVQEILMMDGIEFRHESKQLPIVDSHDRSTVRNVLGSVRDIAVEDGELVGRAVFADDKDSQIAFGKLKGGHLTDFSITATPKEIKKIPKGESIEFNGKTYHAKDSAIDLVTRWTPTDASLVGVGADKNSRVRKILRSYNHNKKREKEMPKGMDDETKEKLIEHGMPEDMLEDEERAIQWMLERMGGDKEEEDDMERADEEEDDIEMEDDDMAEADDLKKCRDYYAKKRAKEEEEEEIEFGDDEDEEKKVGVAVERALRQDRKRRSEIKAICRSAGISSKEASRLADSGVSLKAAKRKVLKRMANKPLGRANISVGSEGVIRRAQDMRDALILRHDPSAKVGRGAANYKHTSMLRMAEEILEAGGFNTRRMNAQDIARTAMGHESTINRMRYEGQIQRADAAYHTQGAFPNLLLDVTNKALLKGYEESPPTWSQWARTASPVKDFKEINKIKFSESPNLQHVPENSLYPEARMSDAREKYSVEKFGSSFTCTWELIINDDLDALSRIAQLQGAAARRTQNQTVYNVLFDNNPMADGTPIFDAAHGNLGSGAPSVASLNAAYTAMRLQTGLDGSTVLNISPSYIIIPAALEATVYQLLNSTADPSVGGDTTGSSGVANIYGPSGARNLTVVVDPVLDGNSSTAWYLAAQNSMVDTVELSFLSGENTPVLENEFDMRRDSYYYKIRQTWGSACIDHRGLYKSTGV